MYSKEFYAMCKNKGLNGIYDFHYTDVHSGEVYITAKRKNTKARWLILAINELNIFAIWDLESVKKPVREKYKLQRKKVIENLNKKALIKAVEYPNRQLEKVYLVPQDDLADFINNY